MTRDLFLGDDLSVFHRDRVLAELVLVFGRRLVKGLEFGVEHSVLSA